MDFALTEEQEAIQEMARRFAADELAPHASEWDEKKHFPVDVIKKSAELGLAGIYTSEDVGGSGLGRLDAALTPLAEKFRSFGFEVEEVNGHDVDALRSAFGRLPVVEGQPSAIICNTVKGKGIPPAEHSVAWHHRARLNDEELGAIRAALGGK